jgi:protein-L-isoaspartate(D-aspartate) O-methyltransferase
MYSYKEKPEPSRDRMVEEQLAARGITDKKVLDVFRKVPRHNFIDPGLYQRAYTDHPLPIGKGQTISQPYMVAFMVQLLQLRKEDKVLEIGTGSGYGTAILAELAKDVFSIETIEELAVKAEGTLKKMGYKNILIKTGDGTSGWEEESPFDKIVVTAGSPEIPRSLIDQLANSGKLVIPVGSRFSQTLTLIEKSEKGAVSKKSEGGCAFVPLIGKYGWKKENES